MNLTGLILNLIGVFLLTFNSFSESKSKYKRPIKSDNKSHEYLYDYIDSKVKERNFLIKSRVNLGLIIVLFGFSFQLLAIFL